MESLISVLMSVYNGEKFLKKSIESILNQTFKSFEFIIINDGSTDSSEEIIHSYNDQRIKYLKNDENIGLTKSLNIGIKIAKGKYLARMDSDDISLEERLEKQFNYMETHHDIDVCGTWIEKIGSEWVAWKPLCKNEDIYVKLLFNNHLVHSTVMIKKDFLEKNKLYYNEDFKFAQDYDFWARAVFEYNAIFSNLDEILLLYRCNDKQISSKYLKEQEKVSETVKKYMLNFFGIKSDMIVHIYSNFTNNNYKDISSFRSVTIFFKMLFKMDQYIKQHQQFNRRLFFEEVSRRLNKIFICLVKSFNFPAMFLFSVNWLRYYCKNIDG